MDDKKQFTKKFLDSELKKVKPLKNHKLIKLTNEDIKLPNIKKIK